MSDKRFDLDSHMARLAYLADDERPTGASTEEPMVVHINPDQLTQGQWAYAEGLFGKFMKAIGQAPESSDHLADTPRRYTHMLRELFHDEPWKLTVFEMADDYQPGGRGDPGIVIVRNIPVKSMCAHHFAPFMGVAHVAYIPRRKLVGLSKFARAVESFSKGPNVQEEIGANVADFFVEHIDPIGIAVMIQAEHTCLTHRGAKAHGADTITHAVRGVFFEDPRARAEVLALLTANGK